MEPSQKLHTEVDFKDCTAICGLTKIGPWSRERVDYCSGFSRGEWPLATADRHWNVGNIRHLRCRAFPRGEQSAVQVPINEVGSLLQLYGVHCARFDVLIPHMQPQPTMANRE